MAIEYIHPSISSTITDNSTTYVTASGTTKLFAAFTAEKGEDNQIKMITSVSEFIFHYGEPNIKLYGQITYNIINWLQSGGVVYCLRVLPDDAGYANAIINIQTKVNNKQVKDVDGNLVTVDNVTVRPVVTYTQYCNNTKSAIEIDALRNSQDLGVNPKTVDGYNNNMILAVIPKGRGQGYNDLGFRITSTDTYDSTYDFRIYNFEVTKVSDSGSTSTIEGPFQVALDPDALSVSGESMFIQDVVSKYSEYFDIIFNDDNYEYLANIINPNVHPNRIDFFNGISKKIDGEYETYLDEITGKEEDIHMSMIKYDINGDATGERNIIDPTDSIEGSIVLSDNTYRTAIYKRYETAMSIMKNAYSKLKKVKGFNPINTILHPTISKLQDGSGEYAIMIEDAYNQAASAIADLNANVVNDTFNTALSKTNNIKAVVKKIIDYLYTVFDYERIMGTTSESITAQSLLESIESAVYVVNNKSTKYANYVQDLSEIMTEFEEVIEGTNNEKIVFIANTISSISDILSYLQIDEVADPIADGVSLTFADGKLEEIAKDIVTLESYYNELTSSLTVEEDFNNAMSNVFGGVLTNQSIDLNGNGTIDDGESGLTKSTDGCLKSILEATKFAINLTLLEFNYSKLYSIRDDISTCKTQILDLATVLCAEDYEFDLDEIESSIMLFDSTLSSQLQTCYKSQIQNYDSNVRLLYGSDGTIEDLIPSSSEVEKLIIKGYLGNIDDGVTNKEMYPIDMVMDANYSTSIKNALVTLTTEIRNDFVAILDTKCQATPEQAIAFRNGKLSVNNFRVAIFAQDFVVNDATYTSQNMQVTSTYFLSSKIPSNDANYGIHWNFVGPRRGTISGFESISYLPNPEWQELMYKARVNYIIQDSKSTRFNSQLTSQSIVSALSNLNNVRALLRIQREVEELMADYQFEYNDSTTRAEAQIALNAYLLQWTANRCCDSITGLVYASDYDRTQKILRVKIELVFNSIIERIAIDLIVNS